MTEDDVLRVKQGSAWQLLLQFVPPDGPASEGESVQRITEAVEELGLQPGVVKQIEEAAKEALREAMHREKRDQHRTAVCIRVWVSSLSTTDALRPSSDTRGVHSQKRSGWGFFLLERQGGDPRAAEVESSRVIELYLYQDTATTAKKGMTARTQLESAGLETIHDA
jgi:hypothetical protein